MTIPVTVVIAKLGDVCVPVLDVLVRGTIAICGNQLRMTLAEGALQNKATAYTRHPYQVFTFCPVELRT